MAASLLRVPKICSGAVAELVFCDDGGVHLLCAECEHRHSHSFASALYSQQARVSGDLYQRDSHAGQIASPYVLFTIAVRPGWLLRICGQAHSMPMFALHSIPSLDRSYSTQ